MASTLLTSILLVLGLFLTVDAQVFSWGKCKKVTVQADFDLTSYLGRWYEIEKFPASFEDGQRCITATYSLKDNGRILVDNRGVRDDTGEVDGMEGEAHVPNPDRHPAKLKVKFFWWQPGGDYWVLSTDYDSYSVVYSCSSYFFFKMEYAWILSRQRSISGETIHMLMDDMESMGINTSHFTITNQSGCEAIDEA
ncbi:apolipoprotein D-like [Glandiceps talaboti]